MLRGGIIGLGNIALNGHLPAYLSDSFLQKEIKITAVADMQLENREKIKKIIPDAALYDNEKELIENETLDFIDICTPPNTHKSIIQKASKKNLHILCEKPLSADFNDAQKIKKILDSRDLVFLPCHQYHFSPSWQAIRDVIQKEKIGKIHFAQAEVFRISANPGNANWNPAWRTEKNKSGGGILIDHGAHLMYLFISIFGKPVKISATVKKLFHKNYEVEDTACVIMEFQNCLVEFLLTWAGHSRKISYKFLGDNGELLIEEDNFLIKYKDGLEEKDVFNVSMSRDSSHSAWFIPLIKLFIHRIKIKDYKKDGLDEAVLTLKCISLAYQSSIKGRTLSL